MSTGFFAVDRRVFIEACDLGLNQACALLVIACGTGKNNRSSKWSAEAVKNYAGMRWTTAKKAIDDLLGNGNLELSSESKARPKYMLPVIEQPIWVPNSLIVGAADENTMLSRVRETGDPMTLRLLIELYSAQNLLEDGGISTSVIYMAHERKKIGEVLEYVIWSFPDRQLYAVMRSDVVAPHARKDLTDEELEQGKGVGVDFFSRLASLEKIGAFKWIDYLYDSPSGEPLFPLAGFNGTEAEQKLYQAVHDAGQRMIGDDRAMQADYNTVPVLSHIQNVCMISIARLTHRPQTKLTAAWWALSQEHLRLADQYDQVYATKKKYKEF